MSDNPVFDRIKGEVSETDVVLFMKGTPVFPQCGFSTPLNCTPMWFSTCTTVAEKPHCGNTGVPFMNKTTSVPSTSLLIRSNTVLSLIIPAFLPFI